MPMLPSYPGSRPLPGDMRDKMSKAAALRLAPSGNLFQRVMATIDRLLMAHARMTSGNGDLPYFGL
jgi:hypothetical protein